MKSTCSYWNPLDITSLDAWEVLPGSHGEISQLMLAMDPETGDLTRLTRFKDGCSTQRLGAKSHDYPEEIFIISGRLYDEAFEVWLEPGHYASRPPHEIHGPFLAEGDVLVLEISSLSQKV